MNHEELSEQLHKNQMANKSYRNLPQRIMMKRWEDCGRDVYKFWDTIEWDSTWLKHDTPEETHFKAVKREFESHPLKKWIRKPKELKNIVIDE
tara:strand:- start:339 stop:617 length:279 start_codon:yes stop_codon:yes gene_type:complete